MTTTRLTRRDWLRLTAMAAGGGTLAACGTDTSGAGTSGAGTSGAGTPEIGAPRAMSDTSFLPPSPDRPWWLQGNFAPVPDEHRVGTLEVLGALPPTLEGVYVRNGSNPASGTSDHWFMGDGMVHGIRLEGGRAAWYRNRFVDTGMYREPTGGVPGGERTHSNVSTFHHAGRLLSLGEIGFPYELSTGDLGTVGPLDWDGRLTTNVTAHPKIDPATGRMHFFGYGLFGDYLTYMVASAEGDLEVVEPLPLDRCHMIHDFAITDRHAVFWVLPVVLDLDVLDTGMPFSWDPSVPARVGVLPLEGGAGDLRWFDIDPCMVFHGVNAWTENDDILIDVCRMDAAFDGGDLSRTAGNELRRWRLPADGTAVAETTLSDTAMDFPMTDRRHWGRTSRHSWFTTIATPYESGIEPSGVVHRDDRTGTEARWDPRGRFGPGEVSFVADSGAADEGEGWLLTFAYDRTNDTSALLVLDAADVAAGPVATVPLPERVPYGFHGCWVPDPA